MLHKFAFGLLCIATGFSSNVYSMERHILRHGVTLEYELPSLVPQLFINSMFWTVKAQCMISTEDELDELFVTVKAKKGKVNDIELSAGDSLLIPVHHGDNLMLSADSGAKVEITNFGNHTVKATCTT